MRHVLAGLLALAALPAQAQEIAPAEAATLPRLIDSLCLELHPETGCEQAILLESETAPDTADLILLTDRRNPDGAQVLLIRRDAAFNGHMWGMAPSLEAGGHGTLLLHSEQSGIGRHPWFQTLTIGWQDEAFRVLRFEQSTYDRFSSSSFTCHVDLMDGTWRAEATWVAPESGEESTEAQAGTTATAPPAFAELPAVAAIQAPCHPLEALFFRQLP